MINSKLIAIEYTCMYISLLTSKIENWWFAINLKISGLKLYWNNFCKSMMTITYWFARRNPLVVGRWLYDQHGCILHWRYMHVYVSIVFLDWKLMICCQSTLFHHFMVIHLYFLCFGFIFVSRFALLFEKKLNWKFPVCAARSLFFSNCW